MVKIIEVYLMICLLIKKVRIVVDLLMILCMLFRFSIIGGEIFG